MSLKILRVQTPKGQKRYNCSPTDTLLSIKEKVQADTGIPLQEICLQLRDQSGTGSTPLTGPDQKTLELCGLKNGDLLMVVASAELMYKKEEPTEEKGKMVVDKDGNLTRTRVEEAPVLSVEEDLIDQLLSKEDGWVHKKEGLRTSTNRVEDYIAPWDIEKYEPWKSMNLGHIPFHSWSRQSQSGLIEEKTVKRPNTGEKNWQALTQTVKIQRQPYRHVDHTTIEHESVANSFVQNYVKTGQEQFGLLFGTYLKHPQIPLGISCSVSAIFSPSIWNPPPESEVTLATNMASKFGLYPVGWAWTALKPNQKEGRTEGNPLRVNEMHHMAINQIKYPNKCKKSNTGTFGSKFISLIFLENDEGNPHPRSFQLSNQATLLLNDQVIKVSKKHNATKFLLGSSNDRYHIPEILYYQTTEEGETKTTKEKRIERYLDEDILPYFLVTQPVSSPTNPHPKFTSFSFPTAFLRHQTDAEKWSHVQNKLKLATTSDEEECWSHLNDYHFLLFIESALQAQSEDLRKQWNEEVLPQFIDQKNSNSAKALIEFVTKLMELQPKPASFLDSSVDPQAKQQLMDMGYSAEQATEALLVSGGSVEFALNYILDNLME